MRTFAVINQKGGCGKTTVSINLAAAFAQAGRRTLLVDMDPQGHCGLGLAVPEGRLEASVGDALLADCARGFDTTALIWQVSAKMDLAPSTVSLAAAERRLADHPDRDRRLAALVDRLRPRYDLCVIDCPPNIGLLTFNALRAADEVIVPVEAGYFALAGAVKQAATLGVLGERAGHEVRFHILPTMVDERTRISRQILSELRDRFGSRVLPAPIHFSPKLREAAGFGQPIQEYDPACRAASDFADLSRHLLQDDPPAGGGVRGPAAELRPAAAEATPPPTHASPAVDVADPAAARAEGPPPAFAPNAAANSRALELVHRARELARRTDELQRRLAARPPGAAAPEEAGDALALADPPAADPRPRAERSRPARKLVHLFGARATGQGALFVQPGQEAASISIVGDFNNWSPRATPMRPNRQLGVLEAVVPLPPGRHRYQLVIDGRWTADPHNRSADPGTPGGLHSIVEVE